MKTLMHIGKVTLILIVFCAGYSLQAQTVQEVKPQTQQQGNRPRATFTIVEKRPEYPGGKKAMDKFINENIIYPEAAKNAKVKGRVFVSFVITDAGDVIDVQVTKGIGSGCDEEAVRVVSLLPKWKPGMQSGIPVYVKDNTVVHFK